MLTEFSHYNSFLRIKDKLLNIKIIHIESNNGEEYIGLTEKGISVYESLLHLNQLFKEDN